LEGQKGGLKKICVAFLIKEKIKNFLFVKTGSGFRIRNWDKNIRLPLVCRCNGTAECVDESDEDGCEVCGKETWTCSDNRVSPGILK
jgi:hypothetical protein